MLFNTLILFSYFSLMPSVDSKINEPFLIEAVLQIPKITPQIDATPRIITIDKAIPTPMLTD